MWKLVRTLFLGFFWTAVVALLVAGLPMAPWGIESAYSADDEAAAEPAPPADQEYTGAKRCASCHFEQYMAWKKTAHAKTFDLLTSKYEKDPKCLKCHTTGYGEPSGFKDKASSASLVGTTCEACHGPGSKHEEISQPFAKKKTLTPEEEKLVNDSIWRMLPNNVCVECHAVQGHKKSETPTGMQKKS